MMAKDIPTDRLVKVFLKIRTARSTLTREYEARDKELQAQLKLIEVELLRRSMEQGVDGFSIDGVGTTYTSEEWHTSIGDDKAFYDFIRTTGDLDFFERRVTVKHVKEYMEEHDGQLPPGLHVFREKRMRVRSATKKGKKGETDARDD
jgi:hypothetical protein